MTDPLAEIPRDRWSRPLVVPPEGGKAKPYTRCTTYVGAMEDYYTLGEWQQRMVAIGLTDRSDLRISVAAHRDDKDKLNGLCEQAKEAAGASASGTIGTALHTFTEQHDRGTLDMRHVPEEHKADIEAYARATAPFEMVQIEQFGVIDDLKVGGTWDRLVRYEGQNYIADAKSGRIDYGLGKIAMQLAVYSRCVAYDHITETRTPLPKVDPDSALIIHLPAGQGVCELLWVDIAAGWEAVELATQVRAWRSRKGLSTPFEREPTMGTKVWAPTRSLDEQIADARDVDVLRGLWRAYSATGKWNDNHTTLAKARTAELYEAT